MFCKVHDEENGLEIRKKKADDESEEERLSEGSTKKTYIIPGIPQVCLFLLPEKIHMKVLHQRREFIRDIL